MRRALCALAPSLAHIRRAVRLHQLFGVGDRLIVAVSGGADSTALAHVLPEVAASLGAQVVGLAHLNHGLRVEAADDEASCEALAAQLSAAIFCRPCRRCGRGAPSAHLDRRCGPDRPICLSGGAATRAGATRIAVAHTLNDQAETMLLRLVRGAGPVGLAGIYPRAGLVVRPLLLATRGEVETWLRDAGAGWREDASNRDVSIPRNRIRHELMPWLREHFGASVDAVMARQADVFREDAERLDSEATEIARDLVLQSIERSDVPLPPLLARPPAMVRRVLLLVLRQRAGGSLHRSPARRSGAGARHGRRPARVGRPAGSAGGAARGSPDVSNG